MCIRDSGSPGSTAVAGTGWKDVLIHGSLLTVALALFVGAWFGYSFYADELVQALSDALGKTPEGARAWLDKAEDDFKSLLTVENFARWIKEYLDSRGPRHRIVFLVDEIGQFIGQDTHLMLNLQTITENLGTACGGRAWVVVPSPESGASAVATVTDLARSVGSAVTVMDAQTHDEAVATISHLPQVAASLVAAQLRSLDEQALGLAGQGVRDVTRIAASDPRLWTQIIAGNAGSIREVLGRVHADLGELLDALAALADPEDAVGSLEVVNRTITHGNVGHARIPGKHGAGPAAYLPVTAIVPDTPGALARLLTDVGEAGVNLEDLRIDHGLGQPVGLAEIMVVPAAAEHLQQSLEAKGWRVLD